MLLDYFGERDSNRCGVCDLCLLSRRHSTPALPQQLLSLLKEQPLRANEILERMPDVEEATILKTLHLLVDEHRVSINQSLQFFV